MPRVFMLSALIMVTFLTGCFCEHHRIYISFHYARNKVLSGTHQWIIKDGYPVIVPIKKKKPTWNIIPKEELKKRKAIHEWEKGKFI